VAASRPPALPRSCCRGRSGANPPASAAKRASHWSSRARATGRQGREPLVVKGASRLPVTDSTRVSITGISCWHSDCEAAGSALLGSADTDLLVTTAGGKPGPLNADSGYALSAISCVSATTCYAVGAAVLVTLASGVPADALVILTGGTAGSPVIVRVGHGFSGIAARSSSGFIAIDSRSNDGSEDTTG